MRKCSVRLSMRMNRFIEARSKRLNTRFEVVKFEKSVNTCDGPNCCSMPTTVTIVAFPSSHSMNVVSSEHRSTRSQSNDHKTHIKRFIEGGVHDAVRRVRVTRVCTMYSCRMLFCFAPFSRFFRFNFYISLLSAFARVFLLGRFRSEAKYVACRLRMDFGLFKR